MILAAGLIVLIGSVVQGVIGLGLNLIAAPLLVLLDPVLVPAPILLLALVQASLAARREHEHTDWRGVGWALLGRLPGVAVGAAAVALLPLRWFLLFVGVAVLVCVALSLVAWRPAPTRRALVIAGAASGVTGTASSIGGPPVALLYQHDAAPRVRATLGAYFALGAAMSVGGLVVAGQVGRAELTAALWLGPFMLAGFLLSGPARHVLKARWLRPALLAVSAGGALLLIGRALLGV